MTMQKPELTYKYNRLQGRHGWLRLTPAYSVKLVEDILATIPTPTRVLDPFSGTGSTGLVCAEHGIPSDLIDLNPFLVWFARSKTANYTNLQLDALTDTAQAIAIRARQYPELQWIPALHNIERWWSTNTLRALSALCQAIQGTCAENNANPANDLLRVAFCRVMIESSNAAFNHQSMSFKSVSGKKEQLTLFALNETDALLDAFVSYVQNFAKSARSPLTTAVTVGKGDSRYPNQVVSNRYDCVITSPPYPNRMSYIRELRPYMYWLGYLTDAHQAADLDWQAIGGTWGAATSRLTHWHDATAHVTFPGFAALVAQIGQESTILANYVHKYFADIATHIANLPTVLSPHAKVFYVVGNSKFYNTLVPVEEIYAHLLRQYGFTQVTVATLRKRNSKSELFEYIVSGQWQ